MSGVSLAPLAGAQGALAGVLMRRRYLMDNGVGVRAVKPFCSGGKGDIDFLVAAQSGLGQEDLNFWYSDEPISPAAWERRHSQAVDFEGAINWINSLRSAVFSHQEGLINFKMMTKLGLH